MAGGGSLGGGHKPKRGKHSKRKSKKRVGFVLDMTPLVDITFLLLTFFMFTTTMATPQVMEMSVPPEQDVEVEVKMSELLSLLLDKEGNVYYFMGEDVAEKIEMKELSNFLVRKNLEIKNKLITVFKPSKDVEYGKVVGLLDALNVAEVGIIEQLNKQTDAQGNPIKRQRRFTIADFTDKDQLKIDEVQ
ncbi:MAG: ExbD/TolR family protein [Candidatus Kapaibacteriota bacterium]|jgi:biopolymer transport protein ExbD